MNERRGVYWDACAWLGLLNREAAKNAALEHVWRKAEKGEIDIWTSAFCLAEVYKVKCEDGKISSPEEDDAKINNMFDQDFVKVVHLDSEIGKLAKQLLRRHEKLKKPSDAVHLATAIYWDLEQLHTYDTSDLIGLAVQTASGADLKICKPDMIDGDTLLTRMQEDA